MNLYKDIEINNKEGDVEKKKIKKQNNDLMQKLDDLEKIMNKLSTEKAELTQKTQYLEDSLSKKSSDDSICEEIKKENSSLKKEVTYYYSNLNHLEKEYEYLKGYIFFYYIFRLLII